MDPVSFEVLAGLLPAKWHSVFIEFVGLACMFSTACSILDSRLKQPPAGSIWVRPRKFIAFIAWNFHHASNRIPAGLPEPERRVLAVLERAATGAQVVAIAQQAGQATTIASTTSGVTTANADGGIRVEVPVVPVETGGAAPSAPTATGKTAP